MYVIIICMFSSYAELEQDPTDDVGEITLRSRQRLRSSSPTRLRAKASKVFMTQSARMRMRASVVVPGVSEGVLPPNAKPVTSQEALHHLSKIVSRVTALVVSSCDVCWSCDW